MEESKLSLLSGWLRFTTKDGERLSREREQHEQRLGA